MAEPLKPGRPPLYAFQEDGVNWLIATTKRHGTAFLADMMGLGKSAQAIVAADELEIDHITVICPAIACEDWARKFAEWSVLDRKVFIATHRTPIAPKALPKKSVLICSYETALSHRKLFWGNPHGGLLICDEAHYCRNATARRTRAVYGGHCRGSRYSIVQHYDTVWLLSGTPNPRGDPRELWPHLRALRPCSITDEDGEPLTYTAFGLRFCKFEHNGFGLKMVGTRNMPELHRVLSPFVLRRLPEACPDMPEISFETIRMRAGKLPTGVAFNDFPELRDRLQAIIAGAENNDLSAQLQEQLGTLRRLTGLLKIEATFKLCVEELKNETVGKMVVFAFHVEVCKQLWTRLNHAAVKTGLIVGETSMSDRWKAIDSFQN